MFHRAEPDEPGLGVTISTPGLTRSSQVWMFFGVALADHEHDDGVGDDALVRAVVPVVGDEALVDEAGDVALEREVDVVGVEAGDDGAALVAGGAVGRLQRDARAFGCLGEQRLGGVVGGLRDGEADERQRDGLVVERSGGAGRDGAGEDGGRGNAGGE